MADGGATAAIAVAAVASAAVSAYAAYETGQQNEAAMRYQAKLNEREAQAREYAAQVAERQERQKNRLLISRQRALYGGAGIDPGAGTPLLVAAESARQGELDALNIRWSGAMGAGSARAEAALRRAEGGALARQGYYRAGASLLSGAGTLGSLYAGGGGNTGAATVSTGSILER